MQKMVSRKVLLYFIFFMFGLTIKRSRILDSEFKNISNAICILLNYFKLKKFTDFEIFH